MASIFGRLALVTAVTAAHACSSTAVPVDDGWPADAAGSGLLAVSVLQAETQSIGPAVHNPGWSAYATPYSAINLLEERVVGACHLWRSAMLSCPGPGGLVIRTASESHPISTDSRGCPYESVQVPGNFLSSGTTVRFDSIGQPFGAISLSASLQAEVTVQAPLPSTNGTIAVASAQGLDVRWTGQPRFLEVTFNASFPNMENRRVECLFDGSTGAATVPTDALAFVRGASGAGISIFGTDRTTTLVGEWRVDFRVRNAALLTPVDVQ